jgi:hypothetical protein
MDRFRERTIGRQIPHGQRNAHRGAGGMEKSSAFATFAVYHSLWVVPLPWGLEHIPLKSIRFERNMLELLNLERFLVDRVNPPGRKAL